jgi:penicillin-insensitive murein endopeptidase
MRRVFIATLLFALATPSLALARKCPKRLPNPVRLPSKGPGWLIPKTWDDRGLSFGTRTLVGLLRRAAARVDQHGATLYVADISPRRGGPSYWHRSHRSGRDVDILFFALDRHGKQARPPRAMIRYDEEGHAIGADLRFDVERNWLLVKALLEDRVYIDHIFIASPLRRLLLEHARERGESKKLLARAEERLSQPSDSAAHDDHFHVRIACYPDDYVVKKPPPKKKPKPKKSEPQRQARSAPRAR